MKAEKDRIESLKAEILRREPFEPARSHKQLFISGKLEYIIDFFIVELIYYCIDLLIFDSLFFYKIDRSIDILIDLLNKKLDIWTDS